MEFYWSKTPPRKKGDLALDNALWSYDAFNTINASIWVLQLMFGVARQLALDVSFVCLWLGNSFQRLRRC